MNTYIKNDLKKAYMIIECQEKVEPSYQTYMLKENMIPGLLSADVRYIDNVSYYYYDVSGKTSLQMQYEKKKLSFDVMLQIVQSLLHTMREIRKYMLDGDCILLDPEFIFCEEDRIFFSYYPEKEQNLEKEFHKLTEYFVSEADYSDTQAAFFAYSLHRDTMEENYSIVQIVETLTKEQRESSEEKVSYDVTNEPLENVMIEEKKDFWEPVKRLLDRKKSGKWKY